MADQLRLLDDTDRYLDIDWRIDDHAREIGRQGVADARQALAAARKRVAA